MIEYIKAWGRICNIHLYLSGQSKYKVVELYSFFAISSPLYISLFTLVSDVPQFHCPLFFLLSSSSLCSYYNKGVGMLILGRIWDISFFLVQSMCWTCTYSFFCLQNFSPTFSPFHAIFLSFIILFFTILFFNHTCLPFIPLSALSCVTSSCLFITSSTFVLLLQVRKTWMVICCFIETNSWSLVFITIPLYETHEVVEDSQCQL